MKPNRETIAAMQEARKGGLKKHRNTKELMDDLNARDTSRAEAAALREAVRLSGIALLSAACFADEHGDPKAGRFYEKRAYANLKLIDLEPPFMRAKRLRRNAAAKKKKPR